MKKKRIGQRINTEKNIKSKKITIFLPSNQEKIVKANYSERTSWGGYDYFKSNSGIYLAK